MANFCSNCGTEMGERDKFCLSCGAELKTSKKAPGLIGHWEAKEIDASDDYGKKIKGTLTLSQSEIVFFRYALISGKAKEWRRMPIRGIKSIYRTSLFNLITIKYNRKPEKTGFFSRVFNSRTISYKIKNWELFIQNIRSLSPNIKIKV